MNFRIYKDVDKRLVYENDLKKTPVKLKQCFPWSDPENYLSLIDKDGKEVFLIESLNDLTEQNRAEVIEYLRQSHFVMKIKSVSKIKEDIELREYSVSTDSGDRVIHTKLEDWPEKLDDGSIMIKDVSGDIFMLSHLDELCAMTRKNLFPYIS